MFYVGDLYSQMLIKFHFGPCWPNITPTLYKTQTLYAFLISELKYRKNCTFYKM